MADIFPPTTQRPELLKLAEALDSRGSVLRRDDCGDWAIWGNNGHTMPCRWNIAMTPPWASSS
jgi:hypothetical protein